MRPSRCSWSGTLISQQQPLTGDEQELQSYSMSPTLMIFLRDNEVFFSNKTKEDQLIFLASESNLCLGLQLYICQIVGGSAHKLLFGLSAKCVDVYTKLIPLSIYIGLLNFQIASCTVNFCILATQPQDGLLLFLYCKLRLSAVFLK